VKRKEVEGRPWLAELPEECTKQGCTGVFINWDVVAQWNCNEFRWQGLMKRKRVVPNKTKED